MKKKMKGLLSVGLCLAVGLSVGGGLVACNNNENTVTPGEKSEYYLVGNFSDQSLPQASEWGDQHCATVDAVPEAVGFKTTSVKGVYEVTVNLYEDDMFQVLTVGQGWDGQMGYKTFKASLDEDDSGNFQVHDSFPVDDIQIVNSGKYKLTLTLNDNSKALKIEYVEAAPALPVKVSGITLDKSTLTMTVGDPDVTLVATVTPDDAEDKTVTWTSSSTATATVDANGKVTAVAAGTATITAKAGEKTATCAVTVVAAGTEIVDVESVSIPATLAAHCGTITIGTTVLPENATNKTVTYESSDEEVVAIVTDAETGVQTIKALKPGTATITAKAGDKTSEGCVVTVARDYYLRGNMNGWGEATELGQDGIIYFTETATAGVYTTGEVTIKRGNIFKIASVGEDWANNVKGTSLDITDLGAYFEYSGDAGDENLACKDTRKYTFTLNMTDSANPVLTLAVGDDLPETIDAATKLGAFGDALDVGWTGTAEADQVDFVKGADNKWTATIQVTFAGTAGSFQLRCYVDGTIIYIDNRQTGTFEGAPAFLTNPEVNGVESNFTITAGASGTYDITVTLTEEGEFESIVMALAE